MKGPIRQAYTDTGALDITCPHCGVQPGQWCITDDGAARRVPCVERAAAGIGTGDGNPYGRDFSEPRHQHTTTGAATMADHERPDSASLPDAVADWKQRRGPKDVVPRHVPDDAPAIPTGPGHCSYTEVTEDADGRMTGVTHFEEPAFIAELILPK